VQDLAVSSTRVDRARVMIANRRDGGVAFWLLRLYAFALLMIVTSVLLAGGGIYSYFSLNAPAVPDLRSYAQVVPSVSRMYAADGTMLGEFAKEWREVVPFERMPKRLVNAFLAVEDHDFYNHGGIYWKGIGRALWANVTAGDFAQGGSTITQQVAKQFLGGEKSLSRKGKEAIMARRLEAGSVSINGLGNHMIYSPFGGKKGSGYGREGGRAGIEEFLSIKSVSTELG